MSTTIAELNYIVPTTQRPRSFTYTPADGSPRTTVTTEPHRLPVGDLRQEDGPFTLDDDGFALVQHQSAVTDFSDESQIRDVYYPEAERLLKQLIPMAQSTDLSCAGIWPVVPDDPVAENGHRMGPLV